MIGKVKSSLSNILVSVTVLSLSASQLSAATPDLLSYIGSPGFDQLSAVALDDSGNIYVAGKATNQVTPLVNPIDSSAGNNFDGYVAKILADGTVSFATYIGGAPSGGTDEINAIKVDLNGNIFVVGQASGAQFTTTGAFDTSYAGNGDGFVAKFSPTGALLAATVFGGTGEERVYGLDISPSGDIYLSGATLSTNFGTSSTNSGTGSHGAYDSSANGSWDAFLLKLNNSLTTRYYSTYIGGAADDKSYGVAVDGTGKAYVGITTSSSNFPTTSTAYDPAYNGSFDGAVFVIDPTQNGPASRVWASYLGGVGGDFINGIEVDAAGNSYVTGARAIYSAATFPMVGVGVYQAPNSALNQMGFVAKFNPTGGLIFSSIIGGSQSTNQLNGIALGPDGDISVVGWTNANNYPNTPDGEGFNGGGSPAEGSITRLSNDGTVLKYSSNIGTPANENVMAIAINNSFNYAIAGSTNSTTLPVTSNAPVQIFQGMEDGFFARYSVLNNNIGEACTNGVPVSISLDNPIALNGTNLIHVQSLPNTSFNIWVSPVVISGYAEAVQIASSFGASSCNIYAPLPSGVFLGGGTTDSNGEANFSVLVPNENALLNAEVIFQATSGYLSIDGVSNASCSSIQYNN